MKNKLRYLKCKVLYFKVLDSQAFSTKNRQETLSFENKESY